MYTIDAAIAQIESIRDIVQNSCVGLTNGCFDLLHAGHVLMLQRAAVHCTHLFVGVNTDESVRLAKGWPKPWMKAVHRIEVVRNLKSVYGAFFFESQTFAESIRRIRPSIWFKGGDYTVETLNQEEVQAARECGCEIVIIPKIVNVSSSDICARILALGNHGDAHL
jgi:rfaE bifunctional protein nucleotidyltransferase chain/domain